MVNYELGKIYKIVDNSNGNIYIGSTCEPTLARRLSKHVSNYKSYLEGLQRFTTSFQIIANNDYNIVLIELYSCSSKDELHARERYYIETIKKCVNKIIPTRTVQEYREINKEQRYLYRKQYYAKNKETDLLNKKAHYLENRETILEKTHEYYIKNREAILEKKKLKVLCYCGILRDSHKTKHEQTKFHQNYINNLSVSN